MQEKFRFHPKLYIYLFYCKCMLLWKKRKSCNFWEPYLSIAFPLKFIYNNSSIFGLSGPENRNITANAGIFDPFFLGRKHGHADSRVKCRKWQLSVLIDWAIGSKFITYTGAACSSIGMFTLVKQSIRVVKVNSCEEPLGPDGNGEGSMPERAFLIEFYPGWTGVSRSLGVFVWKKREKWCFGGRKIEIVRI